MMHGQKNIKLLSCMLPARRPNFAEVVHTTWKVKRSTQITRRPKKRVRNETGTLQYLRYGILGAGWKLPKATITFVMYVCLQGTPKPPLDGFSWNFILGSSIKICREKI